MTLILELHDKEDSVSVFISDCMVTINGRRVLRQNNFPLHWQSGWAIDTAGVQVVSKAQIFENRILLCAGRVSVISAIAVEFETGTMADFQPFLDAFYAERRITESLIYGAVDGSGVKISDSYCESMQLGHLHVIFGGSGKRYFKSKFSHMKPDASLKLEQLAAEVIAMLMRFEFLDYSFPEHDFGGAYEMTTIGLDGPRRIPYAVLDVIADSHLAEDGIYDVRDLMPKRLILSVPHRVGCLFPVIVMDGSYPQVHVSVAPQIFTEGVAFPSEAEIQEMMLAFVPMFTIILIRHHSVNYVVTGEQIIQMSRDSPESIGVTVDMSAVDRLIAGWFANR